MRLRLALVSLVFPVAAWGFAPAQAAPTAQERCIQSAIASGAFKNYPDGVAKVCGISPVVTPQSPVVGSPTEDSAELPPPECVEELQRSEFCVGEAWSE